MPDIDWDELNFQYYQTNSHVSYTWKKGAWDKGELRQEDTVTMSVAATCLHYGQECFEGLKAFRCRDGAVRVFRPDDNLKRMNNTADFIYCPRIPAQMFHEALNRVIKANLEFIPPYGTGGSLYIRPLLIGTGPTIGIRPSEEYKFIILVTPVGPYYKGGIKALDAMIVEDFDRTAPKGTGHVKLGGNYAAGLCAGIKAKEAGFPIVLYLDSKYRKYIDEFGTSNFIGITADGKYVTPDSHTILPSITNKSLMQIAGDLGMRVEKRRIEVGELADFAEVAACGTAVVATSIKSVSYGDKVFRYGDECGPIVRKLYEQVTGIQFGELEDRYNWLVDLV